VAEADIEDADDPRELARSYDFGAHSVAIGHIRQLKSLGYYVEGLAREPGRRLSQSQTPTRPLSFMSFLLQDCRCRLIPLSWRSTQISCATASTNLERYCSDV
jgi:hypothetical protein